ncbi:MAG: helix-turn-helix domain-containing protein [Pseudonocardiaceae bacterium]
MSKASKWAARQCTGGVAEKAVLFALAAEADMQGVCELTTRQLAEYASTDTGTLSRALKRLRNRGLVTWTTGAGTRPNAYRLPIRTSPPSAPR